MINTDRIVSNNILQKAKTYAGLSGGEWKTINGAKVYLKNGVIVAGAEGKLGEEGDEKLKNLEDRLKNINSKLNNDSLGNSFYGGRVGFKSGSGKKSQDRFVDKKIKLFREKKSLEDEIHKYKNPLTRNKIKEIPSSTFKVGQTVFNEGSGQNVEVIKVNSKSIKVKYISGFTENVKPNFLREKK